MQASDSIPFEERALDADDVGMILGLKPRTVLECYACREDFPTRLSIRPATWRAGDILEWRDVYLKGVNRRRAEKGARSRRR
jgi:predicted DNA-binding transcriptional regulator AlpA